MHNKNKENEEFSFYSNISITRDLLEYIHVTFSLCAGKKKHLFSLFSLKIMLSQKFHSICNLQHLRCIFKTNVNIDRVLYRFHASLAGDPSVYDTPTRNSRLAQTDIYFGEIPFGHLFFFFLSFLVQKHAFYAQYHKSLEMYHAITAS